MSRYEQTFSNVDSDSFRQSLKKELQDFLEKLLSRPELKELQLEQYPMDHVCYRVESLKEYTSYQEKLSTMADKLIESEVSGRLISTYRLHRPFHFANREIELIELPQPKSGKPHRKGFEHAEFVIDLSFEEFTRNTSLHFDWKGASKKHNPELKLKLEPHLCVKFHHTPLDKVIQQELA